MTRRKYSVTEMTRRAQVSSRRRKAWYKFYRNRMLLGLEHCRACGRRTTLTLAHIVAAVNGGKFVKSNLTILCEYHQKVYGIQTLKFPSLKDEEMGVHVEKQTDEG